MSTSKRRKLTTTASDAKSQPFESASGVTKSLAFEGMRALILESGIGKARTNLFKSKVLQLGGAISECLGAAGDACRPTHLIVDDSMTADRLMRIIKIVDASDLSDIEVVRSAWLSECIRSQHMIGTDCYGVVGFTGNVQGTTTSKPPLDSNAKQPSAPAMTRSVSNTASDEIGKQNKRDATVSNIDHSESGSDYQPSCSEDEDDKCEDKTCKDVCTKVLPKGFWVCAQSSSDQRVHHNQLITDQLEAMAKAYESMNDKWRALGYRKAIMALIKCNRPVTSFEEAKAIPGIGIRLAEKIWEIAESGELQKLKELTSQEEMKALDLFTNVWGAGAHTARSWVQRGFRTLDDLRADDAGLTRNQRIGLKHYDEFLERMGRDEAGQIESVVKEMALSIQPGLTVMACGSFRRGKSTCGDVDVLITHPDGHSHSGVFAELISRLTASGFLTDHLVSIENNGDQKKYLGVCRLPGANSKHRRLDIIVVPYNEFACACLYFTGSAHFNRSMRNLAARMNMSLSEHALCTGVVREKGVKVNRGVPLHTPTEESVFAHLGLTYRPPEERDH